MKLTNETISNISQLLQMQKSKNRKSDLKKINKAYCYAEAAHKDQVRLSGEKYIIHPLNVAYILSKIGMDDNTICAALLHDVIEDTVSTYDDIQNMFGEEVAIMVEGVTKLGKLKYTTKEESQVENYRKMFLAMGKDIRVILVKIADRLHNMRTMNYMKREKQILKSKETLDIYAPLANRLGMHQFKGELEDLGFKYLMPEEYHKILVGLDKTSKQRNEYLAKIEKELNTIFKKNRIKYELSGRTKHIYSIYKKMKRDDLPIDRIYDIFALRVIVNDIPTCYSILGLLHEKFTPMIGRFKDYIAVPKSNMYQSIHTTLIIPKESPFEVQIRTHEMHEIAEFGIAAHWAYKEANYKGKKSVVSVKEDKLSWVRQTIEWQEQTNDPEQFMETLKTELFEDEVYVFTPKGDIKVLVKGATTIDFAYMIHEHIGNKLIGAKLNGVMVPITTVLKNGDIVNILTSEASSGPSRDWLKVVKTPTARARITKYFKKETREENIEKGKEILEKEIKRLGYKPFEVITVEALEIVKNRYALQKIEDVYAAMGFGNLGVNKVTGKLLNIYKKTHDEDIIDKKIKELEQDKDKNKEKEKEIEEKIVSQNGLYIKGIDNLLIKPAKCCNPVPGDEIIGYITQGRGVSVHRTNCRNISKLMKDHNRIIDVYWSNNITQNYVVELEIYALNVKDMVKNLILVIDKSTATLTGLDANVTKDELLNVKMKIVVKTYEELNKIILSMQGLENVLEIKRKRG